MCRRWWLALAGVLTVFGCTSDGGEGGAGGEAGAGASSGGGAGTGGREDAGANAAGGSPDSGGAGGGAHDGCVGPAACLASTGQRPDCDYAPTLAQAAYAWCSGPVIWVDTTHENFHQITPTADNPGRFWGFSVLLFADGYYVQDSSTPLTDLGSGNGPDVLTIANPVLPITDAEATAVAEWVRTGGSLWLHFDHPPFDQMESLLSQLGLRQDPVRGWSPQTTFSRTDGTLADGVFLTNGNGADEVVDEVVTFTGSSFGLAAEAPPDAVITAVMTFPPGTMGEANRADWGQTGEPVSIEGLWQGAVIELGAGRVVVLAEAGMFSAQVGVDDVPFGMHQTPDNEQLLLNVAHWLSRKSGG